MLGENLLVGIDERVIDSKTRVILPAGSGALVDDEVYMVFNNDHIELYSTVDYLKKLGSIKDKYEKEMFLIGSSKRVVDKQQRIILGRRIVENLKFDNTVYITGFEDHLCIYKKDTLLNRIKDENIKKYIKKDWK